MPLTPRNILTALLACLLALAPPMVLGQKKPASGGRKSTGKSPGKSPSTSKPSARKKAEGQRTAPRKSSSNTHAKGSNGRKSTAKPAQNDRSKRSASAKPAGSGTGASISTKQEELDRLRREIREGEQRLDQLRRQERTTRQQVDEFNRQTRLLQDLITRLRIRAEEYQREVEASRQQLLTMEQRLALLQERYARWIVNAYKRGRYHDSEILLSSGSLNQMLTRARYLRALTQQQRADADEIRRMQGRITDEKTQLESRLLQQRQTVQEKTTEENRLRQKVEQQKGLLGQLSKDRAAAQSELRAKQSAARRIEQLIAELVERERQRALAERRAKEATPSRSGSRASRSTELPGKPISETAFGRLRGRLPWPVTNGSLAAGFGEQRHPELNTVTINNGIDIAAAEGAPVRVVADGTVSVLFYIAGYGNLVIVNHDDDFRTVYARVNGISVGKGQRVKAGQSIARIAPSASGPQVHFELWRGRQKQNPLGWLAGR